jgi:chromosome segregation ATPase
LQSLESNFQQLGRTKDEQLKSANDAITLWENRCVELTSKMNDIQESYEVSHAEWLEGTMAELQEEINRLMRSNEKLNSEITFVKDLLTSAEMERDLLKQQALTYKAASENALTQLRENLIQSENLVIELQSQKGELSSALAVAEEKLMESSQTIELMQNHASESDKEHRNFQHIISQLQYELREVYEALQTKVTDELTEMVSY